MAWEGAIQQEKPREVISWLISWLQPPNKKYNLMSSIANYQCNICILHVCTPMEKQPPPEPPAEQGVSPLMWPHLSSRVVPAASGPEIWVAMGKLMIES